MVNQKITVDFQIIDTRNPKLLMIGDTSFWSYAENKPAYILITLPGSSKAKSFTFKKHSLNNFNSHNLGISCLKGDCTDEDYKELPDGIYTICVKSSYEGIEHKAYYLKTDRFDLELSKTVVERALEYDANDKSFREAIFDIKWWLFSAQSQAKLGDFVKANMYFNKAKELLNKHRECANCN